MKHLRIKPLGLPCRTIAVICLSALSFAANAGKPAPAPTTAAALKAYGATSPTVAGSSSGGFMAVQIQVAFSGTFKGAAVVAGGPYYCAQGSANTATTSCKSGSPAIPVATLISKTEQWASTGDIDATGNIARQNVYMFSGTKDGTVAQAVMNALQSYLSNYMSTGNIDYNKTTAAAHGWVTWKTGTGINACTKTASPYLINCGIDVQQSMLGKLYGSVNTRAASATGQMLQFDQSAFVPGGNAAAYSLDSTGWIYVPAYCAANAGCKAMVALHGCQQSYSFVGNAFINNSGLNEYADTNNMLVIYPQAIGSRSSAAYNPYGCWDWWGYTGSAYAHKTAVQTSMIKAIVDRVMSPHY